MPIMYVNILKTILNILAPCSNKLYGFYLNLTINVILMGGSNQIVCFILLIIKKVKLKEIHYCTLNKT